MWRETLLTPLAIYNYDQSVFDLLEVPQWYYKYDQQQRKNVRVEAPLDVTLVRDNILLETSELSIATVTDPAKFKLLIQHWCKKEQDVWRELWATLHYEYNPIHNYDREEHGLDKDTQRHIETPDLRTVDELERDLHDKSESKEQVGAFNNGLAEDNVVNAESHGTGGTTNTNKRTGTLKNDADDKHQHDFHAFGNIGVTTTTQMIAEQRESVQFNMVDYITESFKKQFCILIY